MLLSVQLTDKIQNLDLKSLEELQLFIEKLLKKQKHQGNRSIKNARQKTLLADMECILIPVNNTIIDRADLYENRI